MAAPGIVPLAIHRHVNSRMASLYALKLLLSVMDAVANGVN